MVGIKELPENISKEEFNNWDKKNINIWVGLDSEFQTDINRNNQFITVQLNDKVYEHPDLEDEYRIQKKQPRAYRSLLSPYLSLNEFFDIDIYPKNMYRLTVHLGLFFSPADIIALFSNTYFKDRVAVYVAKQLEQYKRISVHNQHKTPIYTGLILQPFNDGEIQRALFIQIHDAAALMGQKSLKDLAKNLGLEFEEKETFTQDEKENMLEMYKTRHEDFIKYAAADSVILRQLFIKNEELWHSICDELQIKPFRVAYTLGANVCHVIERLIVKDLVGDVDSKTEKAILKEIRDLNTEASPKHLARDYHYYSQHLSLIDGGRCKNERPTVSRAEGFLVDIDIESCYGTSCKYQKYPIGMPVVLRYRRNVKDNRPTLGELLDSKEYKDFIPGLWFARISTTEELSFEQDLIFSKIPPESYTKDTFFKEEDKLLKKEVSAAFQLFLKEIINGGLNHDMLQILRYCCSNNEWGELKKKIIIDSLIFYPKSMQCKDYEEWRIKHDEHNLKQGMVKTSTTDKYSIVEVDERSRYWVAVPMDKWMGKLLELKKKYKEEGDKPKEVGYKNIINSIYGTMTSIFFPIANVCVGNNITARVRAYIWLSAKALGMYHTITDGGVFDANNVNYWKGKKPSLKTLTYINERERIDRQTRKNIISMGLGNKSWTNPNLSDKGIKRFRRLVLKHIREFFKDSNIDVLNEFNYKVEKVIKKASFQSQANYRFVGFNEDKDDNITLKARGYNVRKKPYVFKDGKWTKSETLHPVTGCLEKLSEGELVSVQYDTVYIKRILKINQWKKYLNKWKNEGKPILYPGSSYTQKSSFRPLNLTLFRWYTQKQYDSFVEQQKELVDANDKNIGFERISCTEEGYFNYSEVLQFIQENIYNNIDIKEAFPILTEEKDVIPSSENSYNWS